MKKSIKKTTNQNESLRLRELIRELGLPLRRLQDVIAMKPEDCLTWWSDESSSIKFGSEPFTRLMQMVGIDENKLFMGNYDQALARRRLLGDFKSLPDRYQENQNSYLRTSAHIIRYIVLTRGQAFADQVLYSMSVSPLIYDDVSVKINLTYFADLLETLAQKGFTQEELDTLASVIFLSLQGTALGETFSVSENHFDVYKTLAKNFDYFDTNFDYKSQFVGKKYILKTTLPLDEHSFLKGDKEKVIRLMRYRRILSAWFPYLAGMTPLFPKAELVRFSGNIVEMKYEFDLSIKPNPTKLLVV
ncbi:MAG: hypothetical protein JSU04_09465 [Bdellovibrionales bacterium]|nr:hypothetical protein [Bdellovibrionales bacterium]